MEFPENKYPENLQGFILGIDLWVTYCQAQVKATKAKVESLPLQVIETQETDGSKTVVADPSSQRGMLEKKLQQRKEELNYFVFLKIGLELGKFVDIQGFFEYLRDEKQLDFTMLLEHIPEYIDHIKSGEKEFYDQMEEQWSAAEKEMAEMRRDPELWESGNFEDKFESKWHKISSK